MHQDYIFINKGMNPLEEAFSGFSNPDLLELLKEKNIENVFVVGLAYDFCVAYTAYDSCKSGFNTYVIKEACRPIDENSSFEAENNFKNLGIKLITIEDLDSIMKN